MESSLRDQLHCQKERSNDKDRYVIAVVDNGVVVRQLPRKVSLVCSLRIKRKVLSSARLLTGEGILLTYLGRL